jgi:acyl-CoA synthetase (AMP-forming)/AMP-acid ligase II
MSISPRRASSVPHAADSGVDDGAPLALIHELVARQARRTPRAESLVFENRSCDYATLDELSSRCAAIFRARGLAPGERICYLGKNTDRYYVLLLGAFKAGVIMVPLNWRLSRDELRFIVGDSSPRLLFHSREFADAAAALTGVGIESRFDVDSDTGDAATFNGFLDTPVSDSRLSPAKPSDPILIMYTSGTTGRPKGATLTHQSVLRSGPKPLVPDPDWFRWTSDETALIAMPVFHIGGTGQGLRALRGGCRVVVLREFDVDQVLHAVARYRVGKLFLVPAAMQSIVRSPLVSALDISCLRWLLYGASPISEALMQECLTTLRCRFIQMYGSTETSGTIVALSPEDHESGHPDRLRSAGRVLPGVELRILDAEGLPAAPGATGEIAVRSYSNMVGYWNNPEATREVFAADEFMRTGDVGHLDADGYLFVLDRAKDMIISGGENIYPAEVERVLSAHPQVAEVCAFGVASARWGEEVTAAVVLRPGAELDAETLIRWARQRLAAYKLPKSVQFVDALPRNPSGKVLRRVLRHEFASGANPSGGNKP